MLHKLHKIINDALHARSLDWRTCYASVRPREPSGKELIVEVSSGEILDFIKRRLQSKFPDRMHAFSFKLLPEDAEDVPERYIAVTSVADVRKEPAHTSELLTQAVCGDSLFPLKAEGDWALVRLDDGYIGWVRNWNVKAMSEKAIEEFHKSATHRIAGNIVQLFENPVRGSLPVGEALIGTLIRANLCAKKGWRKIVLPNSREGYVRASLIEKLPKRRSIAVEKLAATGLRFLGIPYLWGGTTPKGFDCSGLMQRIFRLGGMIIPRDADMQASYGSLKPECDVDKIKTGDLLFFGKNTERITHVAMYLSDGLFLHAHGHVRVGSMDPRNPLFEKKLLCDWRFSRDPLSG